MELRDDLPGDEVGVIGGGSSDSPTQSPVEEPTPPPTPSK
jgi:hypothetical protein